MEIIKPYLLWGTKKTKYIESLYNYLSKNKSNDSCYVYMEEETLVNLILGKYEASPLCAHLWTIQSLPRLPSETPDVPECFSSPLHPAILLSFVGPQFSGALSSSPHGNHPLEEIIFSLKLESLCSPSQSVFVFRQLSFHGGKSLTHISLLSWTEGYFFRHW